MLILTTYRQKLTTYKLRWPYWKNNIFLLYIWLAINIYGHILKASEKGDAAIMQLINIENFNMKKLKLNELKPIGNISIKELFIIRGGCMQAEPKCIQYACTSIGCSSNECTSNACVNNSCTSQACESASCKLRSSTIL